jgi:hypothetical protein
MSAAVGFSIPDLLSAFLVFRVADQSLSSAVLPSTTSLGKVSGGSVLAYAAAGLRESYSELELPWQSATV